MLNNLAVTVTSTDFIFDFGFLKVSTPKDYIDVVENMYLYNGCLMIETPDDLESIGILNLLYGEAPFYTTDYLVLSGELPDKSVMLGLLSELKDLRWQNESFNVCC